MEYFYVHLQGEEVFNSIMLSGTLEMRTTEGGELHIHGSEDNFNFAPYGIEVLLDIPTVRFRDGTPSHRKAWVSFPYSAVKCIVHHSLSEEELAANGLNSELKVEPIGFKINPEE